jgi:hypothetical protein
VLVAHNKFAQRSSRMQLEVFRQIYSNLNLGRT